MVKRKREPPESESPVTPARGEPPLRPETRHGVLVVTLFALTALTVLALVNLAGPFGAGVRSWLRLFFGWGRWGVPIVFALLGLYLVRADREPIRAPKILGGVALLFAVSSLLNVGGQNIDTGLGGGVFGAILWNPLTSVMGKVATVVLLVAVVLIGVLLLFNTTLQQLFRRSRAVGQLMDKAKEAMRDSSAGEVRVSEPSVQFSRRSVTATAGGSAAADKPKQMRIFKPERKLRSGFTFPLTLLDQTGSPPTSGNIEETKEKIQKTLENFGIQVEMGDVSVGPTVTQYTFKPAEGVKLSQITTLANDLALALAAHPIRIEAPIPGKSLVGVEVPNQRVGLVNMRELLDSEAFRKRSSPLPVILGRDVSGAPVVADLDPMPHLLIAGATGSGKSVMINSLLLSLLAVNDPEELKMILVDPKRVEMTAYNDIPHLMTPVITDTKKTINALRWVVGEMDRRFQILSTSGKRNIQTYHQDVADSMPYIIVVIDELADLMTVAAVEVESAIVRLAQMARAVGIHLVVATQRPSVDVITGLIKANITARVAFTVASQVDSRTILDHSGAEKLLGRGDMLFINADLSKPRRIQGAFVSEREIEAVTSHLKGQGHPEYAEDVVDKLAPSLGGSMDDLADDELVAQAKEVILQAGKASASLLQRRLRIGYARAARLLDILEGQGFIGPGEGAKPREILLATPVRRDGVPTDSIEAEATTVEEEFKDDGTEDTDRAAT